MQATAIATPIDAPPLADEIRAAARALGITMRATRLERGQVAELRSGEGAGLNLLIEGRLKLVRFSSEGRALILELLDGGEVFGDAHVRDLDDAPPTYAEAIAASLFETLAPAGVERVLGNRPSLALAVASLMGERRRRAARRLESQIFQRVPIRLARQLLELAERYGVPERDGVRIETRISQQDLGGLIGASREIVSVTLTEFRRLGAVISTGRKLVVLEAKLKAIAHDQLDL